MERVGLKKEYIILERKGKIQEVAELLRHHFWYFINYKDKLTTAQKETAYFYCFKIPFLTPKRQTSSLNINVKGISNKFYDVAEGERLKLYGKKSIIFINNRLVGELFHNLKILNATDWTSVDIETCIIKEIKEAIPFPTKTSQPPIYLGTDVEFELVYNEKIVRAEDFFKDPDRKYAIGLDGSGAQIEFRPYPSDNIDILIENFRTLLSLFTNKYPKFRLSVSGDIFPLGAHIHFSLPVDSNFVRVLDNWIGTKLIEFSGKARGNYKVLGSFRKQPHGFEYRSLPSFIFSHPALTRSVFQVAQKLAYYYYFDSEGVSLFPEPLELQKLNIQNEYEIIMNAHKFMNTSNIFKNWGIQKEGGIIFTDTWNNEIVAFLINKLSFLTKEVTIHFFGFKKERGAVLNFELDGFQKLNDFPVRVSSDYFKFGIPYTLRTEPLEKNKEIWERIIEKITEIVTKGGEEACV